MNSRKIILLSQNLPYLPGEHFLETELHYLSDKFEEIDLLPVAYQKGKKKRSVPENVNVYPLDRKITSFKGLTYLRRLLTVLTDKQGMKWLKEDWGNASKFGLKGIMKLINWLGMSVNIRKQLETAYFSDNNQSQYIFYSYWLNPAAIALAMLSEKDHKVVSVSRAHGGDLYAYRHSPPYMPLQEKSISFLTKVYLISSDGKEYLLRQHENIRPESLVVSRLGSLRPEEVLIKEEHGGLHIVTCSYMVPVKRIELLIEALKKIDDINIVWTHIGDGPLREKLSKLALELPSNIKWKFTGSLNNKEVMEFYQQNEVDLFVNVSVSEGVPVSIMEAFSFGIPVIATNVGGTSELVNGQNGKLLNKDIEPEHITNAIEEFVAKSAEEKKQKSENAFNMWKEHFNADKNYKQFADQLQQLEDKTVYEIQK